MSGLTLTGKSVTTSPIQNVSGANSTTGFFYLNGWLSHPGTNIELVGPGWTVVGQPTWVVTSVDINTETVTIAGGEFITGSSYQFTGQTGINITGGLSIV